MLGSTVYKISDLYLFPYRSSPPIEPLEAVAWAMDGDPYVIYHCITISSAYIQRIEGKDEEYVLVECNAGLMSMAARTINVSPIDSGVPVGVLYEYYQDHKDMVRWSREYLLVFKEAGMCDIVQVNFVEDCKALNE